MVPNAMPFARRLATSLRWPDALRALRARHRLLGFSRIGALTLGCFIVALLHSPARLGATDTNEFLARIHTNAAGRTLPYRLLLPKHYDPAQTYPVILYLHGAAGRGDDNAKPLDWGPRLFLDPAVRDNYEFFLVAPQCPRGEGWAETALGEPGGAKESESLRLALELVAEVLPKESLFASGRRNLTPTPCLGRPVCDTLVRPP